MRNFSPARDATCTAARSSDLHGTRIGRCTAPEIPAAGSERFPKRVSYAGTPGLQPKRRHDTAGEEGGSVPQERLYHGDALSPTGHSALPTSRTMYKFLQIAPTFESSFESSSVRRVKSDFPDHRVLYHPTL